jgi:hypothetical protein
MRDMLSGFSRPVHLAVRRSRRLTVLLVVMHAGALGAALAIALPWWGRLVFTALVLLSAWRALRRYVIATKAPVRDLLWRSDGGFEVTTPTGIEEAVLRSVEVVEPWLTVFVLRTRSGRNVPVVLLPDAVEVEPFRRLRVRLCGATNGDLGAARAGARGGGS